MIRNTFKRIQSVFLKRPPLKSPTAETQVTSQPAVLAATPKVEEVSHQEWSEEEWEEIWIASSLFPI
jgi:hypothetical protein